jgi:hypothetical protein
LFSIPLPANSSLLPKKSLAKYSFPSLHRLIACRLYRAVPQLTPTERKAETKTNIFRPQNIFNNLSNGTNYIP